MKALRGSLVIASATVLEAFRNRLFAVAILFGLVLIAMSVAAASVSISERARLIVDVGLAASSGLGTVIAVALSITSFAGELKTHTAYPILARPLPRWAFILGKYLGVVIAMIGVVTIMVLTTALTVKLYGGELPSALWGCLWLNWIEMAVVVAVSFTFSALTVPTLAATYSAGVILAGNLATDVQAYADRLEAKGKGAASGLRVAYYVLPDLQDLSARIQAANNLELPWNLLMNGTAYGLAYAAAALALAMWVFSRRRTV